MRLNFENVRQVWDLLQNQGDLIEMLNLHFFDLFIIFQQGPEKVNDFNSLVFVGFLLIREHFVNEIEE